LANGASGPRHGARRGATRPIRFSRRALLVALLAVAIAAWAATSARRQAAEDRAAARAAADGELAALDTMRWLPSPVPVPGRSFWIGAWCSPPAGATTAAAYRTLADAGIDVAVAPLEDRYRRADNLARLALLDTLRLGAGRADRLVSFARDDSLHPDESTRPGWERRVAGVVRAYRDHPSFAGYFIADEPSPGQRAIYGPLTRLLRRLDPAHPAYVNFAGVAPGADPATCQRWRADLERSVREADLPFFTVDAYAFRAAGQGANFLQSLAGAARVSRATGRPFGMVLQLTGHGSLVAATAPMLRYQALESIAYGASCIVWFTYWTPDPDEAPWHWHDGVVDPAGVPLEERLAAVREANTMARFAVFWRSESGGAMRVVHVGGVLPAGFDGGDATVPDLRSAEGAPLTVAYSGRRPLPGDRAHRQLLVINRDLVAPRAITLRFDATVEQVTQRPLPLQAGEPSSGRTWSDDPSSVEFELAPGAGTVIDLLLRDDD
jgi:hypothetical protein